MYLVPWFFGGFFGVFVVKLLKTYIYSIILFCSFFVNIQLIYTCIFNKDTIFFICIDSTLHVGMIKTIVCFDEKYENDTLVRIIFTSIWAVLVLMSFAC